MASTAYWRVTTDDPSTELAPYTAERVRKALATPTPPRLLAPLRVFKVEQIVSTDGASEYLVHARWGAAVDHPGGHHRVPVEDALSSATSGSEITLRSPQPPILCTGFQGSPSLGVAKGLFAFDNEKGSCATGSPLLSPNDESTITPGLFLVGSLVRHGELSFCFVYKFRQRFGIVANVIAQGLGHDTTSAIETCRKNDMFLDDLECCHGACGEVC